MNKNIEIQKIKVNNGQELIQKVKEYKNSSGDWKLRERYLEMPFKSIEKRKNKLGWGIIISNGKQTIDILSSESNLDYKNFVEKDLISFDEINVRSELHQLFPEVKFAHPGSGGNEKLDNTTHKELKKDNEDYILRRYLVAEDSWHLKQILGHYVRENESKIYQSSNPHFSGWVEIIDGQDGNVYLYVGEKKSSGGREIKIGITKEEYEKTIGSKYDEPREALENIWDLFIIDRPLNSNEKENYYRSLEKMFQEQWPYRERLCRGYWESVLERMEEKANYWNEKAQQAERLVKEENRNFTLAEARAAEIRSELDENKNIKFCSDKCQHYLSKKAPNEPVKEQNSPTPISPKTGGAGKAASNKNNQISDTEKSQILRYFINKGIKKITINNGKLVIEYNNSTTKTIENKDQQLQKYYQFIQTLPNQSLSLSELQNNNNSSVPNKNNTGTYIGLAVGAFVLGGIFVYFLARKKKK